MGNCSTTLQASSPEAEPAKRTIPSEPHENSSKATTDSDPIISHRFSNLQLSPSAASLSADEFATAHPHDSLPRIKSLLSRASDLMSVVSSGGGGNGSPSVGGPGVRRKLSRVTHDPLCHSDAVHAHVRDVMTHVLGQKKDQDRAVCVPRLLPGVLYCGVFDGHGRNGEIRSELATTELPRMIAEKLGATLDAGKELGEGDLHRALDESYLQFHKDLDRLYEETVFKQAVDQAKQHYGDEANENNVRMPQDGGTTATSVLVAGDLLVIGWVGDSRAVLCRRAAPGRNRVLARFSSRLKIEAITEDHNVSTNNMEEMERVAEQGGEIYGSHLTAYQAEGMLQLTRSLGDSPFHRTGLVVSKPGMVTVSLADESQDPMMFLLVASDGLWDRFSNREALSFVYKRLKKERYCDQTLTEQQRGEILIECARALENEAVKRATDKKSQSDDITVLILTFSKGWELDYQEDPAQQSPVPNF